MCRVSRSTCPPTRRPRRSGCSRRPRHPGCSRCPQRPPPRRGGRRRAHGRGRRGRRCRRDRARAEAREEAGGRDDEGAERDVAGLAELEDDRLHVAVLRGLAAVLDHGGRVALAAEDDPAAGREDDRSRTAGGVQLHRRAGARQSDRVERLALGAVVEQRRGDDGRTLGVVLRLGDDVRVLDPDVTEGGGSVVRLDLERLRVIAGTTRGKRTDRDHDGSGGKGAASKAAAHGGGNSLNVRLHGREGRAA